MPNSADPRSRRARILRGLRARIAARTRQPAFQPAGAQLSLPGEPNHLSFQRLSPNRTSTVLCAHEIAGTPGRARLQAPHRLGAGTELVDLVDGTRYRAEADGTVDVELPAFGVRWLRPR